MNAAFLIAGRELRSHLRSPFGYIVAAATLLIHGLLFQGWALAGAKLSAEVLHQFFYVASGTTMVACVLLSMRLLAEERQTGTLVLLNTAPLRDRDIVLGKFLSAFLFVVLLTALTAYMPALIFVNGKVSVGHIFVGNGPNLCPACQTGGKLLADRALSRLLREDWPRTLEELEALKRR